MTFVMLGQAGGAMLSSSGGLHPVELPAHRLVAEYPFDLGAPAPPEEPAAEVPPPGPPDPVDPPADRPVAESVADGPVLEWITALTEPVPVPGDCRPPLRGSVCLADELRAPEPVDEPEGHTIPEVIDPYDLVPDRVRSVEDWRPLVAFFFKAEHVERALRIIRCESRGDPAAKNPRSSASGLFQHLRRYWPVRASKAGYPGASVFDPVANVAASAYLVYEGGGWAHWTCRG